MKTRTVYIADDGTEFSSEAKCKKHEALVSELDAAIDAILTPTPDPRPLAFGNGDLYIQHEPKAVNAARAELARIAARECPNTTQRELYDHKAFFRFVNRFMCIDARGREWGQPYYARNPTCDAKRWES